MYRGKVRLRSKVRPSRFYGPGAWGINKALNRTLLDRMEASGYGKLGKTKLDTGKIDLVQAII